MYGTNNGIDVVGGGDGGGGEGGKGGGDGESSHGRGVQHIPRNF